MKVLVAGWFSFDEGHATAGDMFARDVVCEWLAGREIAHDMAVAASLGPGVDILTVDPGGYSHLVFVCGPFEQSRLEATLLRRFENCKLLGLDLSMPVPLADWNPFDWLVARDSSEAVHPDTVFASQRSLVPVVGVCLVEDHPGALTERANAAIAQLMDSREITRVMIDTRMDANSAGLRSPSEVESLIARMDVVVTTRLHGMVLALKNGVPAIAIDPIPGGAKIRKQAERVGWSAVFGVDDLNNEALRKALAFALTPAAREQARRCAELARHELGSIRDTFLHALLDPAALEVRRRARLDRPAALPWMEAALADNNASSPRARLRLRLTRWVRVAGRRLAILLPSRNN